MKHRLFFSLLIAISFVSCKSKDGSKGISQNLLINTRPDTIGFAETINKTKIKLKKYNLQDISDSIKYYVYQTFYDEKIVESDLHPSYFSFFPLMASTADVFNNYDNIKDTFLIRYSLVIPSLKPNYHFVDVLYRFNKEITGFQKSNASIVGKIYQKDRWLKNTSEGTEFVRNNQAYLNKWYLDEYLKRNNSR